MAKAAKAAGKAKPEPSSQKTGTARVRSPNYPGISLRKAVELVKHLVAADGKAGSPEAAALKHMGFSGMHGYARAAMSSLKKFDLIDTSNGRIKPTDHAINIVRFPDGHPRRTTALRHAAMSPPIYKEVIAVYLPSGELPSDESLRPEIETDFGFNPKAVGDFLTDFRETLNYAGLLDDNRILLDAVEEVAEGAESAVTQDVIRPDPGPWESALIKPPASGPVIHAPFAQPPQTISAGLSIRFDLSNNNMVEIRMKSRVSPEEFKKILRIIELSEISFVEPTVKLSMMMGQLLTAEEEKKLSEVDSTLTAALSNAGKSVRVCVGIDDGIARKIGFVEGMFGPPISTVTAEEFLLLPKEVLAQKVVANIRPL